MHRLTWSRWRCSTGKSSYWVQVNCKVTQMWLVYTWHQALFPNYTVQLWLLWWVWAVFGTGSCRAFPSQVVNCTRVILRRKTEQAERFWMMFLTENKNNESTSTKMASVAFIASLFTEFNFFGSQISNPYNKVCVCARCVFSFHLLNY